MNLPCVLFLLLLAAATGCKTTNPVNSSARDPYIPKQRTTETTLFSNKPETVYRFTPDQLARMSHTRLDTNRVVRYLENRWPIQRLSMYCVETNTWPEGYQNLVAHNCAVETDLHRANTGGFDRVWVYVDQDDGHGTYVGEAGTKWHRWTFSLNVQRGSKHWVIIESLPNDFIDSDKYARSEPVAAPNGGPAERLGNSGAGGGPPSVS